MLISALGLSIGHDSIQKGTLPWKLLCQERIMMKLICVSEGFEHAGKAPVSSVASYSRRLTYTNLNCDDIRLLCSRFSWQTSLAYRLVAGGRFLFPALEK